MTKDSQKSVIEATFGGEGWSPRTQSLGQELGALWGDWGVGLEWAALKAVMLHRPGPEIEGLAEPDKVQMLKALYEEEFTRAMSQDEERASFRIAPNLRSYNIA